MSLLGYQLEHVWILGLALLVIPFFVWLALRLRTNAVVPYPPVQYQSGRRLPKIFFGFTLAMEILLLLLLILSLSKPFKSTEITMVEQEGIDILLVVDISSSMQAKDFQPNRLEEESLSTAYELILPTERKTVRSVARHIAKHKVVREHPRQLEMFSSAVIQ